MSGLSHRLTQIVNYQIMNTIQILEAPAKNRLLVSWREIGLCNYTDSFGLYILQRDLHAALSADNGFGVEIKSINLSAV
jgi:hypothetical protein